MNRATALVTRGCVNRSGVVAECLAFQVFQVFFAIRRARIDIQHVPHRVVSGFPIFMALGDPVQRPPGAEMPGFQLQGSSRSRTAPVLSPPLRRAIAR